MSGNDNKKNDSSKKGDEFKPSSKNGNKNNIDKSTKPIPAVKKQVEPEKKKIETKKDETNKTPNKVLKIIGNIFKKLILILFILGLLGILVVAGLLIGVIIAINNGIGALDSEAYEIKNYTTYIYDSEGELYTQLDGSENRTYANLSEISPYLPKAFVAIEDERFYEHNGVDIKRTAAATFKYVTQGASDFGGSTITQQVVKKVTGEEDRSAFRKAREIIRAFQVEKVLTKEEILELYMNLIYLGSGAYGVETASFTYFNKSAKDLSIAQCALIAGLAQAPEGYNPYQNPKGAKARQETVLYKMHELGYITTQEYEEAKLEELNYQRGSITLATSNSYFVDAVVNELIQDIMKEKDVSETIAQKMVYNNGYHIYTTLNQKIQTELDEVYKNPDYFKVRSGNEDSELQSAMVIIDYKKGNVVALIGGTGEKDTLRGYNRATQMTRSIGSNMKPIGVYAPAIQLGLITPATTVDDAPVTYNVQGKKWTPKNYDYSYRGLTSIRKAIEVSDNIVAAKVMQEKLHTQNSYDFLQKFGITSLTSNDLSSPASLSLGGMYKGISPLELAAAYGTIANNGTYVSPKLYTKVLDRKGQVFLEKKSEIREVLSPANAYLVTDMMKSVVVGSEGTAKTAKIDGMDVAAKTGTTSDDKDRWFSGFTPYYVASVWVGYDLPKYINVATNPGVKVWQTVMKKIHEDLPDAKFEKPSGVVEAAVCRDSGLIATDACRQDKRGSRVTTEIFNKDNLPKEKCNIHEFVEVCPATLLLPNQYCKSNCELIKISRLNRHYAPGMPTVKPRDYQYEKPSTYCDFHTTFGELSQNTDSYKVIEVNNTPSVINNNTNNDTGSSNSDNKANEANNGNTVNNTNTNTNINTTSTDVVNTPKTTEQSSSSSSENKKTNNTNTTQSSNTTSSSTNNKKSSTTTEKKEEEEQHMNSFWWTR